MYKSGVEGYLFALEPVAAVCKHPKFKGEAERRIATVIRKDEVSNLIFRQKRTLLARHLPIDFTLDIGGVRRLPVTRIYVGPGPSQRISQISVAHLLRKHGYENIRVELSAVPYRVP
jgi:hypothetical protein